ncbi:MAG: LiaI-LiaF-like domain-containing protein [Bacteroidales bacterium]
MKSSRIFISCLLIIFGLLLLLNNFNVISFSFYDFKVWVPFIIILLGITMIPFNPKAKSLILIIVSILSFLVIYFFYYKNNSMLNRVRTSKCPIWGYSYYNHDNDNAYEFDDEDNDWEYFDEDSDLNQDVQEGIVMCENYNPEIETVNFNINCALENYYISDSKDSSKLICFNNTNKKLMYSLLSKGTVNKELELKLNNKKEKLKKETNNQNGSKLEVNLHKNPIWDLEIESAAAYLLLDLENIKVNELDISGVTSDIDLTLGELEKNVEVEISSVMANLNINIPKDAYCEIDASTIMNSKHFENFVKKNGKYVLNESKKGNANCEIYIELSSTMSNVNVKLY